MSLLRIRASLAEAPARCEWALVNDGAEAVAGEGALADLPRRAGRVQLVVPAAQVLITHARLPASARRQAGSVLAYALEEQIAGEAENAQVSWLGRAGDDDVLALLDKAGLKRWLEALDAAGLAGVEVCCETLLLPRVAGEWSLAWDGREGTLRSGELEGAVTDCGDSASPPLSLRLLLNEAQARGVRPAVIALYTGAMDAVPDIEAWQRELGVVLRRAGTWDWRKAAAGAGVRLEQQGRGWRPRPGTLAKLRPAAWIVAAALALEALALVADWGALAREQRGLRESMVARFRASFPDTVSVVDPVLQMRRKLAEARHAAGQSDRGDFMPMIEPVAAALKKLSAGSVRAISYEGGRMTIELAAVDGASVRRIVSELRESGLGVDPLPVASPAAGAKIVLTVRAS